MHTMRDGALRATLTPSSPRLIHMFDWGVPSGAGSCSVLSSSARRVGGVGRVGESARGGTRCYTVHINHLQDSSPPPRDDLEMCLCVVGRHSTIPEVFHDALDVFSCTAQRRMFSRIEGGVLPRNIKIGAIFWSFSIGSGRAIEVLGTSKS